MPEPLTMLAVVSLGFLLLRSRGILYNRGIEMSPGTGAFCGISGIALLVGAPWITRWIVGQRRVRRASGR